MPFHVPVCKTDQSVSPDLDIRAYMAQMAHVTQPAPKTGYAWDLGEVGLFRGSQVPFDVAMRMHAHAVTEWNKGETFADEKRFVDACTCFQTAASGWQYIATVILGTNWAAGARVLLNTRDNTIQRPRWLFADQFQSMARLAWSQALMSTLMLLTSLNREKLEDEEADARDVIVKCVKLAAGVFKTVSSMPSAGPFIDPRAAHMASAMLEIARNQMLFFYALSTADVKLQAPLTPVAMLALKTCSVSATVPHPRAEKIKEKLLHMDNMVHYVFHKLPAQPTVEAATVAVIDLVTEPITAIYINPDVSSVPTLIDNVSYIYKK